jgi:putative ABC transport system substrate-binding protein
MRRREFITLIGSAATGWPLAARAQQPRMRVIGFLSPGWPGPIAHALAAFQQYLAEAGYVETQNVIIDYRWAEGRSDRLPELAADLVRRQVEVIVCGATVPAALAAKAATSTIPIVFGVSDDATKLGLVASLARPGGNATGVNYFLTELGAKELGLLHELVPTTRVGLLVNPSNPATAVTTTRDVTAAASVIGVQIDVVHARDSREIEAAFGTLARNKPGALLVSPDGFLFNRRVQLATLATRHAIPAVYTLREYAEAGGLMSYGTSLTEVYRQIGLYTGLILKGTKPADLPVVQSTKFELVINLPSASALGIEVPPTLLARAHEVIE